MPLMQGKSKKAFSKNVETEMNAGKPQKEALAIAYATKRRNAPKKMAKGGKVEIDAKSEDRPMPDESHADAGSQSRNSGDKALHDADWTGRPTVAQSQRPSPHALSRPPRHEILGSDDEDNLLEMEPGSPDQQPASRYDEEGPNRKGPAVSDMAAQHNNGRKPYAQGGMANHVAHQMGEESPGMSDPDSSMMESHDYGQEPGMVDETHPHTGETESDMLRRHAMELAHFAHGGPAGPMNPKLHESQMEPQEPGSMAREIMHKRKMAEGGMVDLEGNSEEDLNNEDQMSFKAGLKEQYDLRQLSKQPKDSNQKGDSREADSENEHDESDVKQIRKKMKKKAE